MIRGSWLVWLSGEMMVLFLHRGLSWKRGFGLKEKLPSDGLLIYQQMKSNEAPRAGRY